MVEPDYRFTLANERTFLAWIRTAMALLAAGIVIGDLFPATVRGSDHAVLATLCTGAAALLSLTAFTRWRRVQEAMRRNDPLPTPKVTVAGTVAIVCVGAIVCTVIVLS